LPLYLQSLEKAIESLEKAVQIALDEEFTGKLDASQQELMESGVIQRFEFTFELAWKIIQRWIRVNLSPESADTRTQKDLFRITAQQGLIADPEQWFQYHEARNVSSHTYDEELAESVFETAIHFAVDVRSLLNELRNRND
jgi:nucleotidyltransferase substrate binding protein (TIGR01987 family)